MVTSKEEKQKIKPQVRNNQGQGGGIDIIHNQFDRFETYATNMAPQKLEEKESNITKFHTCANILWIGCLFGIFL
jgi:hypothetical protein